MRYLSVLPLTLAAIACSSPKERIDPDDALPDGGRLEEPGPRTAPDSTPGSESGSRLKARTYKGADGSRQFIGWYDSERQENCAFTRAADGQLRCLPAQFAVDNKTFFTDSSCSQALLYWTKSCDDVKAVTVSGAGSACPQGSKAFSVTTFTGTVYSGSPGSCTASPNAQQSSSFYEKGAELPAASFVAAIEEH